MKPPHMLFQLCGGLLCAFAAMLPNLAWWLRDANIVAACFQFFSLGFRLGEFHEKG